MNVPTGKLTRTVVVDLKSKKLIFDTFIIKIKMSVHFHERFAELRFKHLAAKVKHYVPSVDGWDEDRVKAATFEEMWKILRGNQCQWDDIISYILQDWIGFTGTVSETLFKMIQFLHVERGVSINGTQKPSNLYLAVSTGEPEIVNWFLERGVSVSNEERYFETIVIPHWNIFPRQEAIVKMLLKAGVPLPYPLTAYLETGHALTHRVIEILAEKFQLEAHCAELEADLKEARDYITDLECRPPELGGPEYEAGLKRWEARNCLNA